MPQDIRVKICGLGTVEQVRAATSAGAGFVGFVFFERSPRHLSVERAAELAAAVPTGICKVALTVDAGDAELDRILTAVPIDMLQLQGGESPDRVAALRDRFGLPVMKAVGIAEQNDLARIDEYSGVADQLLIDAKPPPNATLPGGNGLAFDWQLLAQRKYWRKPWMLAGGLTAENVKQAITLTGARQVDVSTGVESAPGVKDAGLIDEFIRAARS